MAIPPRGVRLPDLDQLAGQRAPVGPENAPGHRDPLPERLSDVLAREVVIERTQRSVTEHRPGLLRERVGQEDERIFGMAKACPDVVRVVVRRVDAGPIGVVDALERRVSQCHLFTPPARSCRALRWRVATSARSSGNSHAEGAWRASKEPPDPFVCTGVLERPK